MRLWSIQLIEFRENKYVANSNGCLVSLDLKVGNTGLHAESRRHECTHVVPASLLIAIVAVVSFHTMMLERINVCFHISVATG